MSSSLAASSCLALKGASLRTPARARKATVARAAVKTVAETPNARVNKFNKSDILVSPSILSADFANLGADVRRPSTTPTPDCGCATLGGTFPNHYGMSRASERHVEPSARWTHPVDVCLCRLSSPAARHRQ